MEARFVSYGLVAVFLLLAGGLYFSLPSASPGPTAAIFAGEDSFCNSGAFGTGWTSSDGNCTCAAETVEVNGNIIITNGYNLTLDDCIINFNVGNDGQYGLTVQNGGTLIMKNNAKIQRSGAGTYAYYFRALAGSHLYVDQSIINGAGFSSGAKEQTGVYIAGSDARVTSSTITGGYNGLFLDSSSNSIVANDQILNNGGVGINITSSTNVSVRGNSIVGNAMGIHLSASDLSDSNITNNYIYLNLGDGIRNEGPLDGMDIKFNNIRNNSGWAIYSNELGAPNRAVIWNNTMCYNTNTTYWINTDGAEYGGATPAYNRFCVNVTRPIRCGCTDSDTVNFYVDGNPVSWVPAGNPVNCSLKIDNVERGYVYTPGAYHTVGVTFNGTALERGSHNFSIHCDPYWNTGDDSGDWDLTGIGFEYVATEGGSGGGGGPSCDANITLAVRWLDGTCNVSYAVLSTNETNTAGGTAGHKNYTNGNYSSPKQVTGNNLWTNFTWWNASVEGEYVNWLAWANDTAGRWNSTTNATFLADPCTNESIVTGVGGGVSTGKCGNITLAVLWNGTTSNVSWAWLSTNETGGWVNYTGGTYGSPKLINSSLDWSNFSWWNATVMSQHIYWRGCANNTIGNDSCTAITEFTAVPCANATPQSSGVCDGMTLRVTWEGGALNQSMAVLSTNETGHYVNYTDGTYGSPKNITEGANYTDFTWWNASVGNQKVSWKVYWNSSLGDWSNSSTGTFTATACAVATVGGGGGGGAAAGSLSGCTANLGDMLIYGAGSGKTVTCVPDSVFKLFNLTFSSSVGPSTLSVEETEKPAGVAAPNANVYKYFTITRNFTDSSLSSVLARFAVSKSWVSQNGLTTVNIGLFRLTGTAWNAVGTALVAEDTNYYYFDATMAEFGSETFALVGQAACLSCPVPGEWGPCVNGTMARKTYACSAYGSCAEKEETKECVPQLVMPFWDFSDMSSTEQLIVAAAAAGFAAVAFGIFLYLRKKKRKARPQRAKKTEKAAPKVAHKPVRHVKRAAPKPVPHIKKAARPKVVKAAGNMEKKPTGKVVKPSSPVKPAKPVVKAVKPAAKSAVKKTVPKKEMKAPGEKVGPGVPVPRKKGKK